MYKNIFIIAVSLLFVTTGCSSKKTAETAEVPSEGPVSIKFTADQLKNTGVESGIITKQLVTETVRLNGMVDVPPQNIVSVSFPLGGYLKNTKLLPGMHVNKGESIGVIEDQSLVQLQQDYLMAKNRLHVTQLEYERQKSLNETKTAADKVFQQAEAEYESNRLQVLGLAEKLRLININPDKLNGQTISRMVNIPSPINGFVSRVNVNIGKYVQPQDVLFELINPSDIHAALTVFEKDLNKIKQGQKVDVSFVDEPDKVYETEVILITKSIDENRSGIVHCHFEKMPPDLKPGMFITATLHMAADSVLALPEDAVVRTDNKNYIFLQNKDSYEPLEVKTGTRHNGWVEIITDDARLKSTPVVTKNAFAVLSKWKNVAEE
jgi:cobalt-zinc-cadmium efflux system membrane fusion protein